MKSTIAILAAAGTVFVLAAPADAAPYKYPRRVVPVRHVAVAVPNSNQVVFSNRVIGTDPDPNIRAYILRDVSSFFGGGR